MNLLPTYQEKINSLKATLAMMTSEEKVRFGAFYESELNYFEALAAEAA
tara:strand:- start:324 stop:470 length:147 start_codon:yes stop_codon:yes gene_type:complete